MATYVGSAEVITLAHQRQGSSAALIAAIGASRKRGSKYYKLKARRSGGRAARAIAHKLLVYVYHILSNGTPCADLEQRNLRSSLGIRVHLRYLRSFRPQV